MELSNLSTADTLKNIVPKVDPISSKRDTFTAILTAINLLKTNLNISLEKHTSVCSSFKKIKNV